MADVVIDGRDVRSESDLHRMLEAQLDFGPYYGRNLAALRDRLLADVVRPVSLIWTASEVSRAALGDAIFEKVASIVEEAAQQDRDFGWVDRFEFRLE